MTEYNEDIDEFAPAKPDLTQPAKQEPEQVQTEPEQVQPEPEPVTKPNAYESIFEQQNDQIQALIAQNKSLTDQITQLIQNGAQIGNAQAHGVSPVQQFNQRALSDDEDWSLESLAKDIGKRPKH